MLSMTLTVHVALFESSIFLLRGIACENFKYKIFYVKVPLCSFLYFHSQPNFTDN